MDGPPPMGPPSMGPPSMGPPGGPPGAGPPGIPPDIALEIRLTTAPLLYGSYLAWMLLGFLLLQTHHYYKHYREDHPLLKAYTYTAVLIEAGQSALEGFLGYRYFVGGWGNPALFMLPSVTDLLVPVFDGVLGVMVQGFYIWRIWRFGNICKTTGRVVVRLVCFYLTLSSLGGLGGCLAIPILLAHVTEQNVNQLLPEVQAVTTVWVVCSAVADIIITISTLIILRHARTQSKFQRTHDLISRVAIIALETGIVTSFLALFLLIAFLIPHTGTIYTLPSYLLGKSYAISLLANLNARKWHDSPNKTELSTTAVEESGRSDLKRVETHGHKDRSAPTIQISTSRAVQPLRSPPPRPSQQVEISRSQVNDRNLHGNASLQDRGYFVKHPYAASGSESDLERQNSSDPSYGIP